MFIFILILPLALSPCPPKGAKGGEAREDSLNKNQLFNYLPEGMRNSIIIIKESNNDNKLRIIFIHMH